MNNTYVRVIDPNNPNIYLEDGIKYSMRSDGTYEDIRNTNNNIFKVVNELKKEHFPFVDEILRIYNKDLLLIDLSNINNITDKKILNMIEEEASRNIWFYFRYIAKVEVNKDVSKSLTFNKFMIYKIMSFIKKDNLQTYYLSGRQMGNTLISMLLFIYEKHYRLKFIDNNDKIYAMANYYISKNINSNLHNRKMIFKLMELQSGLIHIDFKDLEQSVITIDDYIKAYKENEAISKKYVSDINNIVIENRKRTHLFTETETSSDVYNDYYEKITSALETGLTNIISPKTIELAQDLDDMKIILNSTVDKNIPLYLKINSIDAGMSNEKLEHMKQVLRNDKSVAKEIHLKQRESMTDYAFHELYGGENK